MQPIDQTKSIIKGALILTLAAFLTKVLSAVYRIPFQNIVGDIGFYIYQQVYPIYGLALIFSTTGYPVILSKLYAEQKEKYGIKGTRHLMIVSGYFLALLGVSGFLFLYFGAGLLANGMKDPELALPIRSLSFFFLILPCTTLLRGYFQGEGNMIPIAYSQVGEQVIRVGTILLGASYLMATQTNMYKAGAGAVFGSITGGLAASGILLRILYTSRNTHTFKFSHLLDVWRDPKSIWFVKILLTQGFAVCLSGMLLLLLQLADSFNLYSLLLSTGLHSDDAKALKGIYDRGQPLIQLGAVVATSLSLSLVPLIASGKLKSNIEMLQEKIQLAIIVSITFGLGATIGLMTIMKQVNTMLFENGQGSDVLSLLSLTILLSSVIITFNSILQGLGYPYFPAMMVLVAFILKLALNGLFVPKIGIMGAVLASNLALLLILCVLTMKLISVCQKNIVPLIPIVKISIAAVSMFLVLKGYLHLSDGLYDHLSNRTAASIQAITAVVIGGITYLIVIIRTHIFTIDELSLLPFGSRLMYFYDNKKRR